MSIGKNRELAESKLILLYIIDKINMPVSNLQITKIILENKFMNYFFLQQFITELCDNGLLACRAEEDKIFYTITPGGKETLNFFPNLISSGIRARIDATITEIKMGIRNETLITADFEPENENEYIVNCKVMEDNVALIDLKVLVGTKNDARMICDHWKKNSQTLYAEIIDVLTKKRD